MWRNGVSSVYCLRILTTGELMSRVRTAASSFFAAEDAIAITEYGLLVALVAILMIGVVSVFGSNVRSWFLARTASITTV